MIHDLKVLPPYYAALADLSKPFEVRRNDRGFKVSDTLLLREWADGVYSGRELRRTVTYVLAGPAFGVGVGYAVLGLACPTCEGL